MDTLEGPGIVKSQCPICRQPAWKKELRTNHKYLALSDATAQLAALLQQGGWTAGVSLHACASQQKCSEGREVAELTVSSAAVDSTSSRGSRLLAPKSALVHELCGMDSC